MMGIGSIFPAIHKQSVLAIGRPIHRPTGTPPRSSTTSVIGASRREIQCENAVLETPIQKKGIKPLGLFQNNPYPSYYLNPSKASFRPLSTQHCNTYLNKSFILTRHSTDKHKGCPIRQPSLAEEICNFLS